MDLRRFVEFSMRRLPLELLRECVGGRVLVFAFAVSDWTCAIPQLPRRCADC